MANATHIPTKYCIIIIMALVLLLAAAILYTDLTRECAPGPISFPSHFSLSLSPSFILCAKFSRSLLVSACTPPPLFLVCSYASRPNISQFQSFKIVLSGSLIQLTNVNRRISRA